MRFVLAQRSGGWESWISLFDKALAMLRHGFETAALDELPVGAFIPSLPNGSTIRLGTSAVTASVRLRVIAVVLGFVRAHPDPFEKIGQGSRAYSLPLVRATGEPMSGSTVSDSESADRFRYRW